ncbi:MAG TPA: D-glucuronyl C5-epimerase family protein [Solirubrobacter sp.]|nr:D-glucuronyl C5-epimerase family protein [Solirubrobacter sp.]
MKFWPALLLGVVFAGCGSATLPAPEPPRPTPRAGALDMPGPKVGMFEEIVRRQREADRRRRAQIAAARRSPTVEAALRVARLTERITPKAEARFKREWTAANRTLAKLTGIRRTELDYIVQSIRTLAARHELTADRIDPTFLILRTNARFWARNPIPASGWRTGGPEIFQYFPGRGLQLHPLASWGRTNALAGACLDALRSRTRKDRCRRAALTRSLDRLAGLGVRRSGFLAWEYYFAYGSGLPPWISGMAQATAVQALSRGYRALGVKRWRRAIQRALGAFERPAPTGVRVSVPGGSHYALYSFAPDHHVFNGGLQAVIGLRDAAALTHSKRAQRLFRAGERAARREVRAFDTGAWSLYSRRGAESTLGYHELIAGFLGGLCDRVKAKAYCRAHKRFERYEREPTRIAITPLRKVRADRPSTVRFTISKISDVKVRVWGTRGMSFSRDLRLPRGSHAVTWHPPGRGRYRLRIEARGPSGPVGVEQRTIKIKLPKPKPKKKKAAPRSERRGKPDRDATDGASRRRDD